MIDVRGRLQGPGLPGWVERLGFRGPDVDAVLEAAAAVAGRPADVEWIADAAEQLVARIGDFAPWYPGGKWDPEGIEPELVPGPDQTPSTSDEQTMGLLPMLALVVTAPEVAAFHTQRGVPADISAATLSDLGQQVWVHRMTYRRFGLHTQGWLTRAWCGALYWLGRLQFELHRADDEWLLSTHIPRTGPLTPSSVDESFAAATSFFARHFPDYPTGDFYCESWLLDPQLAAAVPHSNLADFQRRWTVGAEGRPGDADVLFFVFGCRDHVDLGSLPRDTGLRRAIVDRWAAGQHWTVTPGRLPQHQEDAP